MSKGQAIPDETLVAAGSLPVGYGGSPIFQGTVTVP
jgi:hypothetical protein